MPLRAVAQDDAGFLVNLLQKSLSGAGREVRITGFEGALSSNATLKQLTVADDSGIWLTVNDVVLRWNRGALLRGRVEVSELSAAEILMPRMPTAQPAAPSPEAGSFSIPELPVAISVEKLSIGRAELGKSVLGQPAVLSLDGAALLEGQKADITLASSRVDGRMGRFDTRVAYDPDTRNLTVGLTFEEEADGIAAHALNIPGTPDLNLTVQGDAPIADFLAQIALETAGEPRLSGTVRAELTGAAQAITVDLSGALEPLLQPDQRPFFAGQSTIQARYSKAEDGRITVEDLALRSAQLDVTGAVRLDADRMPELVDVTGVIADAAGGPVRVPFAGKAEIGKASFDLSFDAGKGQGWTGSVIVDGLSAEQAQIDQVTLDGTGTIEPGHVTADLTYAATGAKLANPDLAVALGDAISGQVQLVQTKDAPFDIPSFVLIAAGSVLRGTASIADHESGVIVDLAANLQTDDLSRFSALSGQDLTGAATLDLSGQIVPITGAFDLSLTGQGDGLAVGQAQADALMAGTVDLAVDARRDGQGLALPRLDLRSDAVTLAANGTLATDQAQLNYALTLNDIADLIPEAQAGAGSADLTGKVTLGADNQLTGLETRGHIGNGDAPVRIALPDRTVTMRGADLTLLADAALQTLKLAVAANDISTAEAQLGEAAVTADIQYGQTDKGGLAFAKGPVEATLSGIQLLDAAVAQAIGPNATFKTDLTFESGAPLTLRDITGTARGLEVSGQADVPMGGDTPLRFDLRAALASLSQYSALAVSPLRGAADLRAVGTQSTDAGLAVQVTGALQDFTTGDAAVGQLMAGRTVISADLTLKDGVLRFDPAEASNANASVQVTGTPEALRFDARLRNVGLFAPDFPGAATATGTLTKTGNGYRAAADVTGPNGTAATVGAQFGGGAPIALTANGSAPLGFANPYIAPRRLSGVALFDLAVSGGFAPANVTGTVRTTGARLSAPSLAVALADLNATITLAGGSAQVAVTSGITPGGRMTVDGTVGLTGAMQADLTARLTDVIVRRADLLDARLEAGEIFVRGPLAGDAAITGQLNLAEAEIRVPNSTVTALGEIPDITHVGTPAGAAQTLARAGLSQTPSVSTGNGGSGVAYRLDVLLNAPGRIFVRGRGLDAELGGRLRIQGTTANILPNGQFNLIRGRLDLLTQRFELDEGSAQLVGSFDPTLRLVARTEKSETTISIIVSGQASAPAVSFQSSPELPEEEVLALLIFDKSLTNLSPFQALQLASAVATLAGKGGVGTLEKLRKGFGLDDLDVTTAEDGTAAVKAGKYISENVYSDVTVRADGKAELNLNLDLSRFVTAKVGQRSDGGSSVGVFFEKDY
ncbi:translocation/assembly module TamB domain-containing protein [Pseudoprimorskyibacter insulae]|nr:translocation/assembly module TamB domain-containing protein [Pseudoprimorskyibacter insulae]